MFGFVGVTAATCQLFLTGDSRAVRRGDRAGAGHGARAGRLAAAGVRTGFVMTTALLCISALGHVGGVSNVSALISRTPIRTARGSCWG
jgi:hypothetical protein